MICFALLCLALFFVSLFFNFRLNQTKTVAQWKEEEQTLWNNTEKCSTTSYNRNRVGQSQLLRRLKCKHFTIGYHWYNSFNLISVGFDLFGWLKLVLFGFVSMQLVYNKMHIFHFYFEERWSLQLLLIRKITEKDQTSEKKAIKWFNWLCWTDRKIRADEQYNISHAISSLKMVQ